MNIHEQLRLAIQAFQIDAITEIHMGPGVVSYASPAYQKMFETIAIHHYYHSNHPEDTEECIEWIH